MNAPENTAARVALWRALHVQLDAPPHVLDDVVGLKLVDPGPDWQKRPDMSPFTRPFRASIVARGRFVEELVEARAKADVDQYVILGAGLDTFAQRRPDLASRMVVFEVDQPAPQQWKMRRLSELGLGVPDAPWHVGRDGLAEAVSFLGLLCGSLAKIATDVILLSCTKGPGPHDPPAGSVH